MPDMSKKPFPLGSLQADSSVYIVGIEKGRETGAGGKCAVAITPRTIASEDPGRGKAGAVLSGTSAILRRPLLVQSERASKSADADWAHLTVPQLA